MLDQARCSFLVPTPLLPHNYEGPHTPLVPQYYVLVISIVYADEMYAYVLHFTQCTSHINKL